MKNDDSGEKKRPNERYNLSPDKNGYGEGLPFYYNRERRLEKAPEAVRNFYNGQQPRTGLLHSLTADRPRKILFFMIILLCLTILLLLLLGYFDTSYQLDGNKIEITSTNYEETAIIILKKTVKNKNAYNGAVDIAVSPVVQSSEEEYSVFTHRIFFSAENEEIYRFAVPFVSEGNAGNPDLLMVLQTEKSTLQIKFKPE